MDLLIHVADFNRSRCHYHHQHHQQQQSNISNASGRKCPHPFLRQAQLFWSRLVRSFPRFAMKLVAVPALSASAVLLILVASNYLLTGSWPARPSLLRRISARRLMLTSSHSSDAILHPSRSRPQEMNDETRRGLKSTHDGEETARPFDGNEEFVKKGPDFEGCVCDDDESAWVRASETLRDRVWLTCADPRALFPIGAGTSANVGSTSNELRGDGEKDKLVGKGGSRRGKSAASPAIRTHQKVVSFSVFSPTSSSSGTGNWSMPAPSRHWINGVAVNSRALKAIYPGWDMRVYHRFKKGSEECAQLCAEREANPMLSLCFVQNIPRFPAVISTMGTLWRFLPMIDAGVDVFTSRDADSVLNSREARAVEDWLRSGKTLHVMHDHPHHGAPILAGMWGTNVSKDTPKRRSLLRRLAKRMILASRRAPYKSLDQDLLANHIGWAFMSSGDYVDHSSYLCNSLGFRSRPFPTKRNTSVAAMADGTYFVGAQRVTIAPPASVNGTGFADASSSPIRIKCPPLCRPSHGKDWTYC